MFQILFPSDEKLIRRLLAAVAEIASIKPTDNALVKLGGANKLAEFFTADVVISLDASTFRHRSIRGREELVELAAAARANLSEATIKLHDIGVVVSADRQSATAQLTALATFDGSTDPLLQLLKLRLKRVAGEWKIFEVDTLKTPGL